MAGRPPKIMNEKTGAYTKARKEAEKKSTPVYQSQEFKQPDGLSVKEKEIWDWLVNVFRQTLNCMVTDADVQLMELYCRAKAAADEADEELKKDNRPYILIALGIDPKTNQPKTTAKPNPNIKKRHDNMLLCLKYFNELGLSPLARARVGVKGANAQNDEDMWNKLMERKDD